MTAMQTVDCYRIYVWRGHWQLSSTHDTADAVHAEMRTMARTLRGARVRIVPGTRKVAAWRHPDPPGPSKLHREAAADNMVVRRQAHAYHKSGCNGTELLAEPGDLDQK